MESCWLIEFVDGYKVILSEEYYKRELERGFADRAILCEQHWFNSDECIKRNKGVPRGGIGKVITLGGSKRNE